MGRLILAIACAGAMSCVGHASAQTQSYPSRPITLIVPFPAGGPADTLARILSERMRVSLGQPFIIENLGGAGGSIAITRVVRATSDGGRQHQGAVNVWKLPGRDVRVWHKRT